MLTVISVEKSKNWNDQLAGKDGKVPTIKVRCANGALDMNMGSRLSANAFGSETFVTNVRVADLCRELPKNENGQTDWENAYDIVREKLIGTHVTDGFCVIVSIGELTEGQHKALQIGTLTPSEFRRVVVFGCESAEDAKAQVIARESRRIANRVAHNSEYKFVD